MPQVTFFRFFFDGVKSESLRVSCFVVVSRSDCKNKKVLLCTFHGRKNTASGDTVLHKEKACWGFAGRAVTDTKKRRAGALRAVRSLTQRKGVTQRNGVLGLCPIMPRHLSIFHSKGRKSIFSQRNPRT